jgi:hypothetical protein
VESQSRHGDLVIIMLIDEIGGWALDQVSMDEIDAILHRHLPVPIGPEFTAPPFRQLVKA